MNLHSAVPRANFNEEKQTAAPSCCAAVERPRLSYWQRRPAGWELSQLLALMCSQTHVAQISVANTCVAFALVMDTIDFRQRQIRSALIK